MKYLGDINVKDRSYEICYEYLENSSENFWYIPKKLLDKKLCDLAIKKKISFFDLPEKFIDRKSIEIAITHYDFCDIYNIILCMKEEYKDNKMLKFILKTRPSCVRHFNKKHINKKIYMLAFNDWHHNMVYFPNRFLRDIFFIKNYTKVKTIFKPEGWVDFMIKTETNIKNLKIKISYSIF
jgi:hypothetical protein